MTTDDLKIRIRGPLADVRVVGDLSRGDGAAPTGAPHRQDATDEEGKHQTQQLRAELAEVASARVAVEAAAAKLYEVQKQFLQEAEGQLVDLSLEIARKVLIQEIQAERYEVDPIVREALSRLPTTDDIEVRLHPDDLARCGLTESGGSDAGRDVRFVADPAINRAECLVVTSGGTVESSVEAHLSEISHALKGRE